MPRRVRDPKKRPRPSIAPTHSPTVRTETGHATELGLDEIRRLLERGANFTGIRFIV